jgi:iron complex outermembrane receptor protein
VKKLLCGVSTVALLSVSQLARAQTSSVPAGPATNEVSEVIVTGTRQTGVRAEDSAQPIQVVGQQALQHTGQPDLTQALQQNVPSFNVEQYGADAAALTVQAALRGLSPNDTLVLVNGKRRHDTANLSVDSGSPYSGSASVDLSLIPVGAIDHVEVLQDGAAAQYGSDAVAGVVNVILKTADHGGAISGTGGEYYEGDGATGAWYINKGINLNDRGFFNVTVEEKYHDFSRQGGADRRLSNPDGSILPSIAGTTDAGYLNAPNSPNVNNIYGDPAFNLYDGFYNSAYKLTDQIELYSFGSYAQRIASAYENYRVPSKVEGTTSTGELVIPFPIGFNPREKFEEKDYSFTAGAKGDVANWNYDISTTYGRDHDDVYTINSANAALFAQDQSLSATPITDPQRDFYDGSFQFSELTSTVDIDHAFPLSFTASPLNLAFGAEYRRDVFSIGEGEPSSYFSGGAQSFGGYTPQDQKRVGRTNYAFYIDLANDPIAHLHIDLAGRYEHYSDFGSDEVGKLTARYDFTPAIAIRGTISTGFRAPTLQEEFYSGTNVAPTSAFVQLPPNSAAAASAGFAPLKPEISSNYSAGVVFHPMPRLQITADYYLIDLRDRVVPSGNIVGFDAGCTTAAAGCATPGLVSAGVVNAVAKQGVTLDSGLTYAGIQLFNNGANTKTQGLEATATYASDFGDFGHVDWSIGFNYNDTTITSLKALPAADVNTAYGQTSILSANEISALLTGAPKEKAILSAVWSLRKFTVNLREEVYGSSSEYQSFNGTGSGAGANDLVVGATGITDLDIGYKVTPQLKVNIGANNLFDQRPEDVRTIDNRPSDSNNVYGEPAQFSPYGINGGYYYGRVTYTF